jgi:Cys-Gly metallodipeptidase DUG1
MIVLSQREFSPTDPQMSVDSFFAHVSAHQEEYIEKVRIVAGINMSQLRQVVAIPSVSADVEHRPDVVRMGEWFIKELESLGAT